jgi:precorrin-6A/cobalt-precorrin-6A reductase
MIASMGICFERAVNKRVLLLSGTSEGPPLARALLAAGFNVHATVTREEACNNLFGPLKHDLLVEARGFTLESLIAFLAQGHADVVLDATHPFAVRITRLAREACVQCGVAYVRYERPDWAPPPGTRMVDSFAEAAAVVAGGELTASELTRTMLTIGAKQLKHFAHLHERLYLAARILPSAVSIQQALDAGFTPDRILCLRPPFSREFNRAILREYRIGALVTKASGVEGGVEEKVMAARDLALPVIMIRRPPPIDSTGVCSVEAAVQACRDRLRMGA